MYNVFSFGQFHDWTWCILIRFTPITRILLLLLKPFFFATCPLPACMCDSPNLIRVACKSRGGGYSLQFGSLTRGYTTEENGSRFTARFSHRGDGAVSHPHRVPWCSLSYSWESHARKHFHVHGRRERVAACSQTEEQSVSRDAGVTCEATAWLCSD